MGRSRYDPAVKKKTLAKCPKCEKEHYVYINWIGRGVPHIFCPLCAQQIAEPHRHKPRGRNESIT